MFTCLINLLVTKIKDPYLIGAKFLKTKYAEYLYIISVIVIENLNNAC